MGWFRRDLRQEVQDLLNSMGNHALSIPAQWQWLEQKQHVLQEITDEDLDLLRKLQELQRKGLDDPAISIRLMSKAQELQNYLKKLEATQTLDADAQRDAVLRVRAFSRELQELFKRENEHIEESRTKALVEGRSEAIPAKILAFFASEAYRAEQAGTDIHSFLKIAGTRPTALYGHLRGRFSGYAKIAPEDLKNMLISELEIAERETKVLPQVRYVEGTGWNHFILNGDMTGHSDHKAYLCLDYQTFKGHAFAQAVEKLTRSGFRGQIKTYEPSAWKSFLLQDDNIVIHCDGSNDATRSAQLVLDELERHGVRSGGSSRSSRFNVARDFTVPDLPHLGERAQKTSFSDAVALLGCEQLRAALVVQKISSYTEFRALLEQIFASNGRFAQYLHNHYAV